MPTENIVPAAGQAPAAGQGAEGQEPNAQSSGDSNGAGAGEGSQGSGSQGDKGNGQGAPASGDGGFSLDGLSDSAQKHIRDLRGENAKYRNRAKTFETDLSKANGDLAGIKKALGLESEKALTQDDFDSLTQANAASEFRSAVLESAINHGIPQGGLDYFQYLVEKKANDLEEGEELTDEHLVGIAGQVKSQSGNGSQNSSVGNGAGNSNSNPTPANTGEVKLDSFVVMTTTEKSELYEKNPQLYERLLNEAKAARRLV